MAGLRGVQKADGDVDGGPSREVGLPNGHRFRLASECILQGHVTLTDLEMTSGMIRRQGATVAKLWELVAEKKCSAATTHRAMPILP